MRRLLIASLLVLTGILGAGALPARAAEADAERVPLWNGRAPIGDGQYEEAEAWVTVHRPAHSNGAAIVICPGGGYGGLVTDAEGHGIAAWLNRHGITGVVLEYRLPAGRPWVPLLDAQRAIRATRAHAQRVGSRTVVHRDHGFLGRWPPGLDRGHALRRRRSAGRGPGRSRQLSARFRDARLSRDHDGRSDPPRLPRPICWAKIPHPNWSSCSRTRSRSPTGLHPLFSRTRATTNRFRPTTVEPSMRHCRRTRSRLNISNFLPADMVSTATRVPCGMPGRRARWSGWRN